jgi:hypothetical protein
MPSRLVDVGNYQFEYLIPVDNARVFLLVSLYTLMYSTFITILRSLTSFILDVLLRFVFSFSSAFLTWRTMSFLSVAASVVGR